MPDHEKTERYPYCFRLPRSTGDMLNDISEFMTDAEGFKVSKARVVVRLVTSFHRKYIAASEGAIKILKREE